MITTVPFNIDAELQMNVSIIMEYRKPYAVLHPIVMDLIY
jgi:hypothetical protein